VLRCAHARAAEGQGGRHQRGADTVPRTLSLSLSGRERWRDAMQGRPRGGGARAKWCLQAAMRHEGELGRARGMRQLTVCCKLLVLARRALGIAVLSNAAAARAWQLCLDHHRF
jgi:hypothetical protein